MTKQNIKKPYKYWTPHHCISCGYNNKNYCKMLGINVRNCNEYCTWFYRNSENMRVLEYLQDDYDLNESNEIF